MTQDDLVERAIRSGDTPLLSPEEFRAGYASPLPWGAAAVVCNPCMITSLVAISRAVGQLRAIKRMGAARSPGFAGLRAEAYLTILLACLWPMLITTVAAFVALSSTGLFGTGAHGEAGAPPVNATYDFWEARREHPTDLVRHGPAPQEYDDVAPEGVEVVRYPSDVGELLGWVLQPPNATPGTRLPTMVYAHGGFALGEGDLHTAQLFARAGMLVFLPTVRGENGNPGHYEMFFGEVDDLLAATRYVAGRPDVDPHRVFVFGHSAGGVLSSLLALHADAPVAATGSAGGMYLPVALLGFEPEMLPFDANDAWESQLRSMLPHAQRLQMPHTAYVGAGDHYILQDMIEIRRLGARGGSLFSLEVIDGDHQTSLEQAAVDFMARAVPELALDPAEIRGAMLEGDEAAQTRARAALLGNPIPLRPEARAQLLSLATEVTPAVDRAALVRAALTSAPDATLAEMPTHYARLDPETRAMVVSMLGQLRTPRAAELLVQFAAEASTDSDIQQEALFAIMRHCEEGRSPASLSTLTQAVDTRLDRVWTAVERAERDRSWDAQDHQDTREVAGLLLDLVGCLPNAATSPWLARAGGLNDLRLRLFAVLAGLRAGVRPSPDSVRELAAFDETRALLLEALEREDAVALFPDEFRTRDALARSHAIEWLRFPTELGAPPRALEWVAEVRENDAHYVVMRYLGPEGLLEPDTWRVVIAGPYDGDRPRAATPFHTFSDFEPIDAATPVEHVRRILGRFPNQ